MSVSRNSDQELLRIGDTTAYVALAPWFFGIFGLLLLTVGLLFIVRPGKSSERWWKIQQAVNPFRVQKVSGGGIVALGCLCVLMAALFFVVTWALWQR
jgi:hypothetical protein